MDFLVALILATVACIEVQGRSVDPGRHIFNNSSNLSSQSGQQSYATKEVILYLTPSQIRALEEGRGLTNPPQIPYRDNEKRSQAHIEPQVQSHHQNGYLQPYKNEYFPSNLAHPQPTKTPSVEEQKSGHFIPIISPDYHQTESVADKNFRTPKQKRVLKPIPFFPYPNEEAPNNEPKASPMLPKQEPIEEKDYDEYVTRQQLKEQWLNLLNKNIAHFKALEALSQGQKETNDNKLNFHYLSQNNDRYTDQTYASDVYNLVRANNEQQLVKQQADAIANSPSILVHKEISIKQTPPYLISHVPVPIPTPVFIPVPEFNVKVPKGYKGPLEAFREVPGPIGKIQMYKSARPGRTENEKLRSLPVIRDIKPDRPFFVDHAGPVQNSAPNRNSPTHTHEWHH